MRKRKSQKLSMMLLIYVSLVFIAATIYYFLPVSTKSDAPEHKGRQVNIELPNGQVITTYEIYIVKKDKKVFYEGKYGERIDLTDGEFTYKGK